MKPAPFVYHAPTTVEETLELLANGDGAQVLAGGQSLVPLMKMRLAKPSVLVDVNGVEGLDGMEHGGELRIGALVRQQALLDNADVGRSHPLLQQAGRKAGFLATRHRGTVGGSLAYAAPWAELTAASVALDAWIDVRSARGERTVAAREFFVGPQETVLEPDELLTRIRIPALPARTGTGFHEQSARHGDYAQVAAAAVITLDEAGACAAAELVLLRVAPTPHRVDLTALAGRPLDGEALDEAVAPLRELDPPDDIEASGTHRRRVAVTLARRALQDAAARARQEVPA